MINRWETVETERSSTIVDSFKGPSDVLEKKKKNVFLRSAGGVQSDFPAEKNGLPSPGGYCFDDNFAFHAGTRRIRESIERKADR